MSETIYYRVIDHCEESYYATETTWRLNADIYEQGYAAEDCAKDYQNNHDGWECDWPLTIAIHATKEGAEIARFTVWREYEPTFSAIAIKEEANGGAQ